MSAPVASRQSWFRRAAPLLLLGGLAALLALTVARTQSLRREYMALRQAQHLLRRGDFIPEFVARDANGTHVTVGSGDPGTLAVVALLRADCPYCKASLPAWRQLARDVQREFNGRVTFLALTSDSLDIAKAYADTHQLFFPVVPIPGERLVGLLHAGTVPQTVVAGGDGRVQFVRPSALESPIAADSIRNVIRELLRRADSLGTP